MILSRARSRQRGASIVTLLFLAVIVGFFFLIAMRLFPSVNEFLTIRKAVTTIMATNPATAADIRTAFERATEVEYSIKTIKPADLQIETLESGGLRTSFAYNVEVPVFEPMVYILMKYEGSAKSRGH